uniref:ATP-binding cassette, sub-family G (WHITE), member 2a n=1 Tax=Fundulus heteroclitus TaxID=8078 RepID=A0A3Q2P4F6_FUNHE
MLTIITLIKFVFGEVMLFQSAGANKRGATVSFHNIHYKVKQGGGCFGRKKARTKDILIDLNGLMKPGLNAIMGATGSGKSSFLDVLAARKDPAGLSGEVLIDGAPQPPNFKCLSGYVVQDDVVMGTLTVRENFTFSAALRLPSSVTQKEKEQKVDRLIQELGLGRVANSKVGTQLIRGISGGERKRTNIGMELIIDPSVLFLDEPTTGLDASTANSVLLLLKRMANNGRTIILSIHQPRFSIYRLFDSLTLLVNGQQVSPACSLSKRYTCEAHNNPADFFLDVINGDSTAVALNSPEGDESMSKSRKGIEDKLVEEYRNCQYYKQTKDELEKIVQGKPTTKGPRSRTITYNTGFFTQFRWVLKRTFRNLVLNPQTSIAQVAVTLFLALVVGALFFDVNLEDSGIQNRTGALFFIVVNQCFSSLSAAELFITERKLFIHEYISGYYRLSVYFLSKILSDIITLRTIPAIVFTCVAYYMIGLKPTAGAFFTFMVTVALVAYTATAMTLTLCISRSPTPMFCFVQIFAGLLVNLPSIVSWLAWLKYLSIPRYGLSALQANEFTGLFYRQIDSIVRVSYRTGEFFLEEQGVLYSSWGLWQNHLAMAVMTICFLAIAYLKLRFIKKFT